MKVSELLALYVYFEVANSVQLWKVCSCADIADVKKELLEEINSLAKQGIEYSKAIKELRSAVVQATHQMEDLEGEVRKLKSSVDNQGKEQNICKQLQEELNRNLSVIADKIKEEEETIGRLKEEFEESKKTMQENLGKEARLRRELEEENAELKDKLNKTSVENDKEGQRQNLSAFIGDLLLQKEDIQNELENVKESLTTLQSKANLVEMKINETEELQARAEELWRRIKTLEDTISAENLQEFVELKLQEHLHNTNQSVLKQRLDTLEYKFQQGVILDDNVGNSSACNSLIDRIERLEENVSSNRNDTEELLKLTRDQMPLANGSVVEEMSHSLKNVMNESQVLRAQVGDLQSEVQHLNTLFANQLDVEQALHSTEMNLTLLTSDISEMRETLQEFNKSEQEGKLQLDQRLATLQELLNETIDIYINSNTEKIKEEFLAWGEKMNASTVEKLAEFSNETKWKIENFISAEEEQQEQIRKRLDAYAVIIRNLEKELDLNFSRVFFDISRVRRDLAEKASLSQIGEIALSIRSSEIEMSSLTEKVISISLNTSRLSGEMEDMKHRHSSLSKNITEVKQWAALYVDNKKKDVEKQLKKLEEKLYKELNSIKAFIVSPNRNEPEETTSLPANGNQPQSDSGVSLGIDKPCPVLTFGVNIVLSGNPGNSIMAFRCSDIGRYRLKGPSTIACEDGRWNGTVPKCVKLPDEKDIDDVQYKKFKCPSNRGKYKYPLNCNLYYDCIGRNARLMPCPEYKSFDDETDSCVDPDLSDCDDAPAIYFKPENGSPDNLLEISPDGSLFVNKGTTLSLYCISRIEDEIEWIVGRGNINYVLPSAPTGDKQTMTKLTSVTEEDTGPYSCIKNKDKIHTIRIVVREPKAIECPTITVDPPLNATTNYSRMIVSSRVEFSCEEGYSMNGSSPVTCMPDGRWSHPVPFCAPNGCLRPNTTDDPWIQLTPDQEIYELGSRVRLSCSRDAPADNIPASVKCREDGKWQQIRDYSSFPTCKE